MSKLALLFFKRSPKLFLKVGLLSIFLFLLISSFGIGYAIFEKVSLVETTEGMERDFEIAGEIKQNYTADNISSMLLYQNYWNEFRKDWARLIISDNLILLINLRINDTVLQIGLGLSENTENVKTEHVLDDHLNFFNSSINVSTFSLLEELPFALDILMNFNLLNNSFSEEFKIGSDNCSLGYTVNLNEKLFSSINNYMKTIDQIAEAFHSFIAQTDIIYLNKLNSNRLEIDLSSSFEVPFQSLLIILTAVSILLSTWLIEFFLDFYNKQINTLLQNFEKRGLDARNKVHVAVFLPIFVDSVSLMILGVFFLVLNQIFSLNLILAFIFTLIVYIYLFYKRFRFNSQKERDSTKINLISVLIYITALLISILTLIIINNILYALIPPLISSIISIGSSIVLYYIISISLSELTYNTMRKRVNKKTTDSISRLIKKTILSTKSGLKSWYNLTLLIVWAIVITNISSNTFIAEYKFYQKTSYPTDLVIDIEEGFLANISKLESVPGIEFVFPVFHSTQQYLIIYDYYLMNFTKLTMRFPELIERTKLHKINANYTYISESFADELDFGNEDLFPTNFGENQTSIIVNQPVIITRYFPLIKETDNRPFIVANYREEYSEYSETTKLLVDFDINIITTEQLIEEIRESTGSSVSIQKGIKEIDYNIILNIYNYLFFVFASFICLLGFIQFKNKLSIVLNQVNLRGLETGKIRKLLAKEINSYVLTAFLFGILSALFFVLVQSANYIYAIPLFSPVVFKFHLDLMLVFIIPTIIILIIFLSHFKKPFNRFLG